MEFADEAVWLLSAIYYLLDLRPMSRVDWGDGIMYRRGPSRIVVASAPLPKKYIGFVGNCSVSLI